MARILDIPPEILDLVGNHLHGRSLESFLFTCKTLFIRSTPAIKRHNEYIAKWRKTSNKGPVRDDIFWFLWSFACDPIILDYVETLHLWDRRQDWEIDRTHNSLDWRADLDTRDEGSTKLMWAKLIERCMPYFQEVDMPQQGWWEDLLCNNTALANGPNILLTILMLCPNLKELGLPKWYKWESMHIRLQASLTLLAKQPDMSRLEVKPVYRPLQKLKTILPYQVAGYTEREGLPDLTLFLTLPNLESLYCVSSVSDHSESTGFNWIPTPARGTSSLRRIELSNCCIDCQGLKNLLFGTPLLKIFKYSHEPKHGDIGRDFDANAFTNAIATQVGNSLKDLCIRMTHPRDACVVETVKNMQLFKKLDKLEMDMSFLVGVLSWDCLVPVAETLPRSIVRVVLNINEGECYPEYIAVLFRNFRKIRDTRLKELERMSLIVNEGYHGRDEYKKRCKAFVEAEGIRWRYMARHSGTTRASVSFSLRKRVNIPQHDIATLLLAYEQLLARQRAVVIDFDQYWKDVKTICTSSDDNLGHEVQKLFGHEVWLEAAMIDILEVMSEGERDTMCDTRYGKWTFLENMEELQGLAESHCICEELRRFISMLTGEEEDDEGEDGEEEGQNMTWSLISFIRRRVVISGPLDRVLTPPTPSIFIIPTMKAKSLSLQWLLLTFNLNLTLASYPHGVSPSYPLDTLGLLLTSVEDSFPQFPSNLDLPPVFNTSINAFQPPHSLFLMKEIIPTSMKSDDAGYNIRECVDELQKPENSKLPQALLLHLADDFYRRLKPAPHRQARLARTDFDTILRKIKNVMDTATEKDSSFGTKKSALVALRDIAETICRGGYVVDGKSPVWKLFEKHKSDIPLSMSQILSTMGEAERQQMRDFQTNRTALDDMVDPVHSRHSTNHDQLSFLEKMVNLYKADNGGHKIFKGHGEFIVQLGGAGRWNKIREQHVKEMEERRMLQEKSKRMAQAAQEKAREEMRKRKRSELEQDDAVPNKRFLCF
ncbi:hypothetical protein P154DRAFT_560306 [Amniculicola lignicola CBS 123094]|uniref:Uncharacterized protein n=1 Tax=Amniculicola lignicola CBS 123094 TaxID=1392246 RepID=A0A6A5X0H2_9PLEO|nr:hypothetical protein P154DRAFT_560306 [Amniculicola lignicola CBS 123094]